VAFPSSFAEGAKLPYVIVSHGSGATARLLEPLLARIATGGYVAVAPTHVDPVRDEPRALADRVADAKFLMDSEGLLEAAVPALAGHVDPSKVAVVGHGIGACTAMLLAGAQPIWDGKLIALSEPRVRAVVLLSSPGPGPSGFSEASYKGIAIPTLVVTGTQDRTVPGERADWKKKPYELSPGPDKFLLVLQGANRFSYLGQTPAQGPFADATADATLAFLDAYLRGDPGKRDMMISGSVIAPFSSLATIEGK
jgi:predicted dienelactone hydrolase